MTCYELPPTNAAGEGFSGTEMGFRLKESEAEMKEIVPSMCFSIGGRGIPEGKNGIDRNQCCLCL